MVPAEKNHLDWMGLALDEARRALATADVPIGAVVIGPDGAVLGSGRNQREELGDPTAHAEVVAIREFGEEKSADEASAEENEEKPKKVARKKKTAEESPAAEGEEKPAKKTAKKKKEGE